MRRLGELEAEIMDRLWAWQRPATVREVVDDINRDRRVAYTTVMTVADILHRKGWLRREKAGRAWLYEPVRSREEYTAGLMRDALGDSPDRPAALLRFVEAISDEDAEALDAALRAARGEPAPDPSGHPAGPGRPAPSGRDAGTGRPAEAGPGSTPGRGSAPGSFPGAAPGPGSAAGTPAGHGRLPGAAPGPGSGAPAGRGSFPGDAPRGFGLGGVPPRPPAHRDAPPGPGGRP